MKSLSEKLKQRFGLFVIIASLYNLTGCASKPVIGSNDFISHKVNCEHAEQEIRFFERNTYSKNDQLVALTQIMFLGPFTPNYETKRQVASGNANYWNQSVKEEYYRCKN